MPVGRAQRMFWRFIHPTAWNRCSWKFEPELPHRFSSKGSSPFKVPQARTDTVGFPGVASGKVTPSGIRSIGSPEAASIRPL
jgi:hypothetical protein